LNRYGNPSERGRFRCEVPNAAGVNVATYVNIGKWFVSSSTVLLWYILLFSVSFYCSGHAANDTTHRASCNYC
jgi:hypothetical protein